jgi:hypothetical protein
VLSQSEACFVSKYIDEFGRLSGMILRIINTREEERTVHFSKWEPKDFLLFRHENLIEWSTLVCVTMLCGKVRRFPYRQNVGRAIFAELPIHTLNFVQTSSS